MENMEYKLNQKKLRVKKCCASCIYKDADNGITSSVNDKRWCKNKCITVMKDECCEDWMISQEMDMAGGGEVGRVKKAEYIQWFGEAWPKLQALGWDAESMKNHWEAQNGVSVYI